MRTLPLRAGLGPFRLSPLFYLSSDMRASAYLTSVRVCFFLFDVDHGRPQEQPSGTVPAFHSKRAAAVRACVRHPENLLRHVCKARLRLHQRARPEVVNGGSRLREGYARMRNSMLGGSSMPATVILSHAPGLPNFYTPHSRAILLAGTKVTGMQMVFPNLIAQVKRVPSLPPPPFLPPLLNPVRAYFQAELLNAQRS
jgi:hypothetical protein